MKNENEKLRQYMLGSLTAAENEELDLRLIADESFADELNFAENELIEDYLDKSLAAEEADLFARNFLVSPVREKRLTQVLMLRNYARNNACAESVEKSEASFFDKLRAIFSSKAGFAVAALGVLTVVSLVGVLFYGGRQTALESEYAQLNQKRFDDLSAFENLKQVNLMTGNFRGAGAAYLEEERLTGQVLFRLALPSANSAETFQVRILKDGKAVFTQNELRFYDNPNGRELRFLLPAAILKKGAYQIKAEPSARQNSTFSYDFAVQ